MPSAMDQDCVPVYPQLLVPRLEPLAEAVDSNLRVSRNLQSVLDSIVSYDRHRQKQPEQVGVRWWKVKG
jgi:hypothetical protein